MNLEGAKYKHRTFVDLFGCASEAAESNGMRSTDQITCFFSCLASVKSSLR